MENNIFIGKNILNKLDQLDSKQKIALLYDKNLDNIVSKIENNINISLKIPLEASEKTKSMDVFYKICEELANNNFNRNSQLIVAGGGSLSDLAGFIASSYMRGIKFHIVSTSLLSMVDACIGGKNAINLKQGKNLIGSFYNPSTVICDIDFLNTLSTKHLKEGFSEIFKHALIKDKEILDLINKAKYYEIDKFYNVSDKIKLELVKKAIKVKINIIKLDPFEKNIRCYLNFGHTLGHAIEKATNYQISHGKSVAYGIHFANIVSYNLKNKDLREISLQFLNNIKEIEDINHLNSLNWYSLEQYILNDKKNDNSPNWILLKDLEQPYKTKINNIILQESYLEWKEIICKKF